MFRATRGVLFETFELYDYLADIFPFTFVAREDLPAGKADLYDIRLSDKRQKLRTVAIVARISQGHKIRRHTPQRNTGRLAFPLAFTHV